MATSMKARVAAVLLGLAAVGGGATYLSQSGIEQVSKHEGLRLTAYPDPATKGPPWTICYGHTGKDVYKGLTVTTSKCEEWLAQDLRKAELVLQSTVKVPLKQGQYDAYVSFIYNAGATNWRKSTMLRVLNQWQYTKSCGEFPKWKYANKLVLDGIVKRRFEEQTLCLSGGPTVYVPTNR